MSDTDECSVNVPLLRKTLDWAYGEWQKQMRGEISEWHQGDWMLSTADLYGHSDEVYAAFEKGKACGTACCIAGKVALDEGWHSYQGGALYRDGEESTAATVGAELLGLDDFTARELFHGTNTIYNLYNIARNITHGEIQPPPELIDQTGERL